ncbi:hypothetical protein WICMUC_004275 [Wickerhamomyces mucosus]|uniref:UBZ4-type domain-containing protein n=1 Tax=Wickerhamomyces mucosus TaxID=1378264 RepID=A0A9P8TB97_9ASCO|nr:hypothetical protein WICMUC_004275 [Wickerhamomyces mucosus]
MVNCPICGKKVDINEINNHLDQCEEPIPKKQKIGSEKSYIQPSINDSTKTIFSKSSSTQSIKPKSSEPITKIQDNGIIEVISVDDDHNNNNSNIQFQSLPYSKVQNINPTRLISKEEEIKQLKDQVNLPLAEILRPQTIEDYIGQSHLIGSNGIGKTTIAKLIQNYTRQKFIEINATNSNISELKKIFEKSINERNLTKRKTILFCDEIHRFNKIQQDSFLSYVEKGSIILIGATTENPSFQINNALISRCKIFKLTKLSVLELNKIINKGILKLNKFRKFIYNNKNLLTFDKDSIDYLSNLSNGDSRIALNFLELINSYYLNLNPPFKISSNDLKPILQKTYLSYDKSGDFHYDTISAFHKSIRGSNSDAALYYLAKMLLNGENPLYIARRLIRIASEDIGLVNDECLPFAIATFNAIEKIGMPECELALVHCTVKFCQSPKSIEIYKSWKDLKFKFQTDTNFASLEIPLHLRNAPTKLMEDLGYGENYKYNPDYKDGKVKQDYLPLEINHLKFLNGKNFGDLIDPDLE